MSAATVAVAVTTLWSSPDAPGPLDDPAVAARPDPAGWVARLDDADRRALHGRVLTQALLGEAVTVVGERHGWAEVRLSEQPSRLDPAGYPGWVPTHHLTAPPPVAGPTATVTARLAAAGPDLVLSCGTRLPVEDAGGGHVVLRAPTGATIRVARSALAPVTPSGPGVVDVARRWTGVAYLWGGCSGHGVDCSGLVHLAHRAVGVLVGRDADDQAADGRPIAADEAATGDLWTFTRAGDDAPHHVGLCAGAGRLLHSPRTGAVVEDVAVATEPYGGERDPLARRCVPEVTP